MKVVFAMIASRTMGSHLTSGCWQSMNAGSDIGFLQPGKRSSLKPPCTVQQAMDQVTQTQTRDQARLSGDGQSRDCEFPQCSHKLITIMQ